MQEHDFARVVREICDKDSRYNPEAYLFVREAFRFSAKMLKKPRKGKERHLTAKEFMDGLRMYALREYGPMACSVLRAWGLSRTEDFGEVVFNLVEAGDFKKTESDTKQDFSDGYDFEEAFVKPFLPQSAGQPRRRGKPGTGRGRTRGACDNA